MWSLSKGVRGHSPTECHRTIRAHIRSHLDGGPQGWNPHFSGPACCPEAILKASSSDGELPRRSVVAGFRRPRPASFAFNPSALLHLRASESARVESHDASGLCVPSERPVVLKGVGSSRAGGSRTGDAPSERPERSGLGRSVTRREPSALRHCALGSRRGIYLNASNQGRHVMRLQTERDGVP